MVSESNLSSDGRALKWAAAQLGVPPESSPEVCTTAFLRRLAEEDFVPPPRLKDAWQFSTRGSSEDRPALPWIDSDAESELSGRIEEFAGQFFNLPPEQRSAHWERLYADARQWPRLETRLRRLKPGLTIEFKPLPTLSLREAKLIQWIRELFTLPMEERAVRRRQMLRDEVRADIQPWQKAAQRVARRQPAIAALAPDLLLPLATWSQNVKAASRNRQRRSVPGVKWWRQPLHRLAPKTSKAAPLIWLTIMLGSGVMRSLFVSSPEEPRYTPNGFSSPFHPTDPYDIERNQRLLGDPSAANPRTDLPPIEQPKPFDAKTWHQLLDAMEKAKENSSRVPVPRAESPPVESPPVESPPVESPQPQSPQLGPSPPKLPGNSPGTIPGKSLNDFLFPQSDSDTHPAPAAPAGQRR